MKVRIGKYVHWYSMHWADQWWIDNHAPHLNKNDGVERPIDKVVFWLTDAWQSVLNITINKFNQWRGQKIKVKLDYWDTWSADYTMSLIVVPLLKQLRATKHGGPWVDDDDVPPGLRRSNQTVENEWDVDEKWFERWDYVLTRMIEAHEYILNEDDLVLTDRQRDIMEEITKEGLRLFGKYYRALWD